MSDIKNTLYSFVVLINLVDDSLFAQLAKIQSFIKDNFPFYEVILISSNVMVDKTILENGLLNLDKRRITLVKILPTHTIDQLIQAGLDLAIGDFIFEIDNPLNFPSSNVLHALIDKSQRGSDLVVAIPMSNSQSWFENFQYTVFDTLIGSKLNLRRETVRLLSRRFVNAISRNKDKFRYRQQFPAKSTAKPS